MHFGHTYFVICGITGTSPTQRKEDIYATLLLIFFFFFNDHGAELMAEYA